MGGLVACINTSIQHKKCTTTLIGAFGGEKDDGGRRSPSAEMRSRSAETRSRAADCIWISLVEAVVEVVEVAAAAGEGNGSRLDSPDVGNGSWAGLQRRMFVLFNIFFRKEWKRWSDACRAIFYFCRQT